MTDEFDPFAEDYDTSAAETAEDAGSGGGGGIEIAGRYHVVIKTVKYEPAEIEGGMVEAAKVAATLLSRAFALPEG